MFVAVGDRVLIRPIVPESRTPSGLVIPDCAKDTPTVGVIVSVKEDDEYDLHPGYRVVYGQYAGSEVTVNGEDLRVIRKDEVLLVEREINTNDLV